MSGVSLVLISSLISLWSVNTASKDLKSDTLQNIGYLSIYVYYLNMEPMIILGDDNVLSFIFIYRKFYVVNF